MSGPECQALAPPAHRLTHPPDPMGLAIRPLRPAVSPRTPIWPFPPVLRPSHSPPTRPVPHICWSPTSTPGGFTTLQRRLLASNEKVERAVLFGSRAVQSHKPARRAGPHQGLSPAQSDSVPVSARRVVGWNPGKINFRAESAPIPEERGAQKPRQAAFPTQVTGIMDGIPDAHWAELLNRQGKPGPRRRGVPRHTRPADGFSPDRRVAATEQLLDRQR